MNLHALVLIALMIPAVGYAQGTEIPPAQVKQLADDLARIQQLLFNAQQQHFRAMSGGSNIAGWNNPAFVTVTGKFAFARSGASEKADRVADLRSGQKYRVIDKASDWYAVELPTAAASGIKAGWVSASNVVPEAGVIESFQQDNYAQDIYDAIIKEIAQFKRKYDNNRYVAATGFSVTLQLPLPSVSVSFEFKK
jgi:hypothetical protein